MAWTDSLPWNYLRVRGEYKTVIKLEGEKMELPPRARRIQEASGTEIEINGTTSACAENTRGRD